MAGVEGPQESPSVERLTDPAMRFAQHLHSISENSPSRHLGAERRYFVIWAMVVPKPV